LPAVRRPIQTTVAVWPKYFAPPQKKKPTITAIKDPIKLLSIAPHLNVATTIDVDGESVDRDLDEIAREVAQKALNEWGKSDGELLYAKRAPQALYDKVEKERCRAEEYRSGDCRDHAPHAYWGRSRL
jgi:hypothetical protein